MAAPSGKVPLSGKSVFPYVFKDSVVQPGWSPGDMVIQLFNRTL